MTKKMNYLPDGAKEAPIKINKTYGSSGVFVKINCSCWYYMVEKVPNSFKRKEKTIICDNCKKKHKVQIVGW